MRRMYSTLNAVKKEEEKSWGPDQINNHHPALINILAETMEVDGTLSINLS
jgi:aspartyl aminopeptidase